jgi:Glycosyl transferase family 11
MKSILQYICGGLGNQCFCYAMGRSLADRTKSKYIIDVGNYPDDLGYKLRYDLSEFYIRVDACRELPISLLRKSDRRLNRLGSILPILRNHYCYEDVPSYFQSLPTKWLGRLRVNGFWQSEKYFEENKTQLVKDLTLKSIERYASDPVANQIRAAENSVFLHLRSYKDVPGKQDGSLALPVSYFHNALVQMKSMVGNFNLFVFSDDVHWTKSRLLIPAGISVCYIESSGKKERFDTLRDFYMMRLCKHGIIANSSFSWWAGWLGEQDWVLKGLQPIRMRADIACFNENYWPDRWLCVPVK